MVIRVAESRTVAVPLEAAYDGTIKVPLPDIFGHRHLAIPPIVRVEGQEGEWGREVGQTRTIHTSDRGSLHETLRSWIGRTGSATGSTGCAARCGHW